MSIATWLLLAWPLFQGQESPPPVEFPPGPAGPVDRSNESITAAVADLAAPDPARREAAERRLFWIGDPAREALLRAGEDSDPERRSRARRVLDLIGRAAALKPVDVKFLLRGYAHVAGPTEGLGGFWVSPNAPRPIPPELRGRPGEVQLIARPDDLADFEGLRGMRVYLVNTTKQDAVFEAQDSRLNLVQEALHEGAWKPVEYLASSW